MTKDLCHGSNEAGRKTKMKSAKIITLRPGGTLSHRSAPAIPRPLVQSPKVANQQRAIRVLAERLRELRNARRISDLRRPIRRRPDYSHDDMGGRCASGHQARTSRLSKPHRA